VIFSENRCPLFGITHSLFVRDLFRKPVSTFRDHALDLYDLIRNVCNLPDQ
jgi:hypothetical protein